MEIVCTITADPHDIAAIGRVRGEGKVSAPKRVAQSREGGRWRWQDLTLAGKSLACLVFFLAYLGPAHHSDAGESYPWYVRQGLLWPWWVLAIDHLLPGPVRLPFNPGLCSLIAVLLGAFIVQFGKVAFLGTEPIPEWVAATAIAGLAAVMTGPLLRAYEAAEDERLARQGSPGVADRDRST